MNLSELKDAIRVEAGITGPDSYTATIERLINTSYKNYTGLNKYRELSWSVSLSISSPAMNEFALPVDFQLFDDLLYNDRSLNLFDSSSKRQSKARRVLVDVPARYAEIVGTSLFVLPGAQIITSDTLLFKYYRFFELLIDDDEHPVTGLEDVVINAVVSRMLYIMDSKRATAAMQLETKAFMKFRAERAAG